MKRTALILALLLSLSLLCACAETPPPTTTAPSLPPETSIPETTAPPETTVPETTAPPEEVADFSEYEALLDFSAEPNWLARAVGCVFEKPEDIDLYYMFYLGVEYPGSWDEISAESQQSLVDQGFWREFDLQIMPCEKLNNALQTTFGISLEDVTIPESWGYIEAEDAYCSNHSDAYFPGVPVITNVEDDGTTIMIHYTIESYYNTATDEFLDSADLMLTLMRSGDGSIHAVSNVPALAS